MKINSYNIIFCLFALLFLVYGCHKHETPVIQPKTIGFPISSYPFDVGDKWTYQVTDETYGNVDTMVFEVVNESINGNDTVYKTLTLFNGMPWDSTIVTKSFNKFSYVPATPIHSLFDSLWILFPISDTPVFSAIKSDTPVTAGANITLHILDTTYTNLIQIKQEIIDSPYASVNLITICPNIGIVSENLLVDYPYETKTETVLLISYEGH